MSCVIFVNDRFFLLIQVEDCGIVLYIGSEVLFNSIGVVAGNPIRSNSRILDKLIRNSLYQ